MKKVIAILVLAVLVGLPPVADAYVGFGFKPGELKSKKLDADRALAEEALARFFTALDYDDLYAFLFHMAQPNTDPNGYMLNGLFKPFDPNDGGGGYGRSGGYGYPYGFLTGLGTGGGSGSGEGGQGDDVGGILPLETSGGGDVLGQSPEDGDGGGDGLKSPAPVATPEPGTLALTGLGLIGVALLRRRSRS